MTDVEHLEAIKAIRASYLGAVKKGRLPASAVTRQWVLGDACQGCQTCEGIVVDHPEAIDVLRPYRLGTAGLEIPPAHAGCDCSERYTTELTNLKINPFTGAPRPSVKAPKQLPPLCLPSIKD